MNEINKTENLEDESNSERKGNVEDHRDTKDFVKSEKAALSVGSYQLAPMLSLSNCRNSRETSSNVSNFNLGKSMLKKYNV